MESFQRINGIEIFFFLIESCLKIGVALASFLDFINAIIINRPAGVEPVLDLKIVELEMVTEQLSDGILVSSLKVACINENINYLVHELVRSQWARGDHFDRRVCSSGGQILQLASVNG